uniref:hypothetical protein n=1 Tax=Streptomyces anulatus TaxID=1892 RepID=UPI002F917208
MRVADVDAGVSVPLLKDGAWTSFPFDAHSQAQEEDWGKALTALGFELWMSTDGMTGCLDMLPLSLRLWARRDAPRFVIEVNTLDAMDHVLAHDPPAAMEVLARWAPVVQSLAVAGLIGDANQIDNHECTTTTRGLTCSTAPSLLQPFGSGSKIDMNCLISAFAAVSLPRVTGCSVADGVERPSQASPAATAARRGEAGKSAPPW